jgi:transglutaminase-like putative cysteine protease
METDEHGQRFACFEGSSIGPGQAFEASYTVTARIGDIRYSLAPEDVGSADQIPRSVRSLYLRDRSRYLLENEILRETSAKIVGDETNLYWRARKIYDWVLGSLEYERVGGWDLPPTLVKRGTGSCSEYSILYISLCRLAGIPARYVGSVAMRGDKASIDDVYHRWCEVYLPGYGWIPVDPSRGDKPSASGRGKGFGTLSKRLFVTTHGDGDSEYLGWTYNSGASYEYIGKGHVHEEAYAVWHVPQEDSAGGPPDGGENCLRE